MAINRSRAFNLTFHPCGLDEDPGPYQTKSIIPNAPPVEIENPHFKGSMLLIHDTGNEPGCDGRDKKAEDRRGVELQIQGKFKKLVERGSETTHGLWVGGDLPQQLKLGWIMQNVVQLCMKYARKKTEGRLAFALGNKEQKPHMSFPIGQLFTCLSTPAGETPPVMGSEELRQKKWQGAGWIDIDTETEYTFVYKTPFMDLCSWDLLKVPGVSPLPLESIMGDVNTAHILLYDIGITGDMLTAKPEDRKKGALLEWHFSRGEVGDTWQQEELVEAPTPPLSSGAKTPLNDDVSEDEVSQNDDDGGALLDVEENQDIEDDSDASSADSLQDDEEDEEMSRADSQALLEIEGWRPRENPDIENTRARVPYYIEAIDRRRRRKVRIWYVISLQDPNGGDDWWHAKAATELASLCRPRRRLTQFRRGPGARRYTCCAVKTLEQFRHVVRQQLSTRTRLRDEVLAAEKAAAAQQTGLDSSPVGHVEPEHEEELPPSPKTYTPAGIAQKVRRKRGPLLPPLFFVGASSTCGLAFAHAGEGRNAVLRETLVGSIHYEGRLCEELLRLSTDGILRCFTPYDCDRPRVRLRPSDILHVQIIDGLFLGRFHMWQVQTVLRVFVFCSHNASDRAEWVQAVQSIVEAAKAPEGGRFGGEAALLVGQSPVSVLAPVLDRSLSKDTHLSAAPGIPAFASDKAISEGVARVLDPISQKFRNQVGKVNSTLHSTLNLVSLKYVLREPCVTDLSALMTDNTRARRWRKSRRLVLNDRLLLPELSTSPPPGYAADLLEQALKLSDQPATRDIIRFSNAVCQLKAVRFRHWTQNELLSFWLNLYHCLLLHGYLVLGKPVTTKELKRFHTRVSYLVGLRPVSLKEIEQAILRMPEVDAQVQMRAQAGGRARQLLGFCGRCRRRKDAGSSQIAQKEDTPSQGSTSPNGPRGSAKGAKTGKGKMCMPMPSIPQPIWTSRNFTGGEACLFLGREPEVLAPPQQDLRCVFALNRGKKACSKSIPVFHENRLNAEIDNVACAFVQEMVQVEEKDREGRPSRVQLPARCKLFTSELSPEAGVVLEYIWRFMPPGTPMPAPGCKLRFAKGAEEPWDRSDMVKFVYSDPNLNKETFGGVEQVGKEFDAIATTAQALAKLAGPQMERKQSISHSEEVVITVLSTENGETTVEEKHFVSGSILRL
mmetsp:Transcript_21886/g.75263  ORF Transcript_21886/g.75263 Transcript_21886/m.75263 type:complete len:1175 (-) Transcript_21886:83-3607(-)